MSRENGINQLATVKKENEYIIHMRKVSARFYLLRSLLQGFTIIYSFNKYLLSARLF